MLQPIILVECGEFALETIIFILVMGSLAGLSGLIVALIIGRPKPPNPNGALVPSSEGPIFLFDGETLVDCNPAGRALLARSLVRGGDWQRLSAFLSNHFNSLTEKLADLSKLGAFSDTAITDNGKALLMQAELSGGLTKITLTDPDVTEGPGVTLAMAHRAMEDELEMMRSAMASAPILMWRESAGGVVTWANNAYILMAASILPAGREITWPFPKLFDSKAVQDKAHRQRQSITTTTGKLAWFDLITRPISEQRGHEDRLLCYALPIDAAVAAETSLRDFMQTLSKTFAQLPIGLAIFDKDRKLQMFNPALVQLAQLAPDFLTRRPSMLAVLDAMRDKNLLPEPKDYHSWRRQIVEMERAAASGLFQENWVLPDGQTFRVTGRPHPNGGLALMIEDISGEMQRSRRYRSDLEISQSMIDQLEDGIVVFNQSGQLLWCNSAYAQLWHHDPTQTLDEVNIRSASEQWRARCAPTHLWRELNEYIHTVGLRQPWSKDLRLSDGRLLICAVSPIASGATLVRFRAGPPQNLLELGQISAGGDQIGGAMGGKATAAR